MLDFFLFKILTKGLFFFVSELFVELFFSSFILGFVHSIDKQTKYLYLTTLSN